MKVYSPNKLFSGYRYGVKFEKGVGEATERQARVLVATWKYRCPELESAVQETLAEQEAESVLGAVDETAAGPEEGIQVSDQAEVDGETVELPPVKARPKKKK